MLSNIQQEIVHDEIKRLWNDERFTVEMLEELAKGLLKLL